MPDQEEESSNNDDHSEEDEQISELGSEIEDEDAG